MSQQNSKSGSNSPIAMGCGCLLLLMFITPVISGFVIPLLLCQPNKANRRTTIC
jgi:hypothetical protein